MNKSNLKQSNQFAVVLYSGGLDSTVSLYHTLHTFKCPTLAVYVRYGSKHSAKELSCAKKVCKQLNVPLQIVDFDLTKLVRSDLLTTGSSEQLYQPSNAVVPFRNTFLLTIAAATGYTYFEKYCETSVDKKDLFIVTGANGADYNDFLDCRTAFFTSMNQTLNKGPKDKKFIYKIYTPIIHYSKAEIIQLGHRLGVPFELTWTCYKGGKKPCGVCAACVARKEGFHTAKIKDPLVAR